MHERACAVLLGESAGVCLVEAMLATKNQSNQLKHEQERAYAPRNNERRYKYMGTWVDGYLLEWFIGAH